MAEGAHRRKNGICKRGINLLPEKDNISSSGSSISALISLFRPDRKAGLDSGLDFGLDSKSSPESSPKSSPESSPAFLSGPLFQAFPIE